MTSRRLLRLPLVGRIPCYTLERPIGCCAMLATALLLSTSAANGQVNVEPLRQQVADAGFGARLSAAATSYAGNTRGVIFGASALGGLHIGRQISYVVLSGDYTRLNGVVSVAKWFAHARHNYDLFGWLLWEAYGQVESDRFRRVTLRQLVGTGPRFVLHRGEELELFYGGSYMYEHTKLDSRDPAAADGGSAHRFSNYLALTLRAHERIALSSVTYVQPRFDEPSDFAMLTVNTAAFTITDLLRSRIDVTARYDSVKPFDVRATDLELKSALELVF